MDESLLKQSIRHFHDALHVAKKAKTYRARLGYGDGITLHIDGRSRSWVWARILGVDSGAPREILCTKVAPRYGVWVKVERNTEDHFEVMEYEQAAGDAYAEGGTVPNVAPHNTTHSLHDIDPIRVDSLQFKPLLTRPTEPAASLSVYMESLVYLDSSGALQEWPGGAVDLSSYVPTGANTQRIVIVGLDKSDNSSTVLAADVAVKLQGNVYYVPFSIDEVAQIFVANEIEPSAAVRLYKDQTTLQQHDIFKDLRRFLARPASTRNLAIQTADDTVANTTAETNLLGTILGSATIDANTLAEGTTLRIAAGGNLGVTGSPTLTVKIKLGSTEVLSTGGLSPTGTDAGWFMEVVITCRAVGASGAVVATGSFQTGSTIVTPVKTTATTLNTTANQSLTITATWSAADPDNTITCQIFTLEKKVIG
jgi:hypothetical protein